MNIEIHSFCEPEKKKKTREKISDDDREKMVKEFLLRTERPKIPAKNVTKWRDPLYFIPNYVLTMDKTLTYVPNKTNKLLLGFVWGSIPYFREHYNMLLTNETTFIRKSLEPKGIIAYLHCEKTPGGYVYVGCCIVENNTIHESKLVTACFSYV
ncbi:hypothetical protein SteCoe_36824 [Stentor coeruleus]|uniref:Uncharacterized protein n=1 Tax=Stentor coeruleus TaxID=5963 RepID=A0A1R2AP95_9CILI|nr:hypothetical protein SteCoe_36824 [Stentor coeruleus]